MTLASLNVLNAIIPAKSVPVIRMKIPAHRVRQAILEWNLETNVCVKITTSMTGTQSVQVKYHIIKLKNDQKMF